MIRFEYADGRMPVAMTSGGSIYYLTYDQIGSLRIVADAAGNVVKRIDYDSFGNIINDTDPSFEIPFGFAGGLHDRDTGLVRFGYRDYDPDTGRWTAKDPILFAGGDTDLYGYVLNDPFNFVDPEGLLLDTAFKAFSHISNILTTGGPGALTGSVVGGGAGFFVAGIPGALLLGTAGGIIGSAFDPIHAGQPNYGENQLIQHQRAMYEAEMLLREYQKMSKQLDEWHKQTGGYFDNQDDPCSKSK